MATLATSEAELAEYNLPNLSDIANRVIRLPDPDISTLAVTLGIEDETAEAPVCFKDIANERIRNLRKGRHMLGGNSSIINVPPGSSLHLLQANPKVTFKRVREQMRKRNCVPAEVSMLLRFGSEIDSRKMPYLVIGLCTFYNVASFAAYPCLVPAPHGSGKWKFRLIADLVKGSSSYDDKSQWSEVDRLYLCWSPPA